LIGVHPRSTAAKKTMTKNVLHHLDADRDHALQRMVQLLSIPSVSTDPAYETQVHEAAAWIASYCEVLGMSVRVTQPTGPDGKRGHPVVLAKSMPQRVAEGATKRVLFYGHYDVQPPDPVEKWSSPPFEPTVKDAPHEAGRAVFARGASDDKGQVLTFLEALRAYRETDTPLPCHVTVLIEGEEECGSVSLPAFLDQHAEQLEADEQTVCVVSDTSMWDAPGTKTGYLPAITYALRGLVYFDVKLHGPSRDLHSGVYGGTLANPATQLTRVLGKLINDDNQITIPGFYDDVLPVTAEENDAWQKLGFNEHDFTGKVGSVPFGEKDFSTLQRRWVRPACDINGLYGGDMGEGAKTVIPTFAGAKVSFRIPADMNPRKVERQFTDWLHQHDTGGGRWQITNHGHADPVATPTDSPWVVAASKAIEEVAGRPPALVREGATIPVVADFKTKLGIDTLLIGFGLNSDNIHSPDEHVGLDRFALGCRTHAALLHHLAQA
jgi:acetylornithine deacetylase/succinyl-diaminopimelate desuccinylase-like protein